ncbi:MAG TPA: nuclear transport factor 2 family protein, partial [Rubricoccaceae bacterium]
VLLLTLLVTAALPAAAQSHTGHAEPVGPAASTSPVEAVRAAVVRLFDGMRAADSSAVRAAFHPSARLMTVRTGGEGPGVVEDDLEGFYTAVADAPVTYDERVGEIEVRADGGLATAWMPYRFYAGDRFSHCGVNAMQLVLDAAGWRIVHAVDTRRTACE